MGPPPVRVISPEDDPGGHLHGAAWVRWFLWNYTDKKLAFHGQWRSRAILRADFEGRGDELKAVFRLGGESAVWAYIIDFYGGSLRGPEKPINLVINDLVGSWALTWEDLIRNAK